jgi:coenzyme F420 hydrogenase subunit beta
MPCQIQAIRKLQHSGFSKLVSPVKFLIGLMCTECFTYEGLMEKHVRNNLGIKLANIEKINIKGKMLITHDSTVTTIPLAEAKRYTRKTCKYCEDFSATLADISAGGLGLEGQTLIIVRSEQGEKLLSVSEKAGRLKTEPVQADDPALAMLAKLSKKKSLSSSN